MSTLLHCPSTFSYDGLDVDLHSAKENNFAQNVVSVDVSKSAFVVLRSQGGALKDQQVLLSCPDVLVGLVLCVRDAEQCSEAFMFKCQYLAFLVRVKRQSLAAVE
ncbi:hypothetical protein DPMN_164731 [Dreissena polymorpha]|uniref:Uncharacterized protein n=1 Tax=Dreissena polymorpha TaxID=45954 RepID=A0A9D4ETG9_DREPO|nr:hypothetical protein DPMN_164731 [Dreissena polymorpha]